MAGRVCNAPRSRPGPTQRGQHLFFVVAAATRAPYSRYPAQRRRGEIPRRKRLERVMSRERERIRIMVVGEVRLYREGIAASLEHRDDFDVVCTGRTTDNPLRLDECSPDIIVLDMAAHG